MAKLLRENELPLKLIELFNGAKREILIVSPYIQLHDRLKSALSGKLNNARLKVTIIFGKSQKDLSKSLGVEDLDFFKKFPNVEILYHPRLHAKYYANEKHAIITSMNLHAYSLNNNVEIGVYVEKTFARNWLGRKIASLLFYVSLDEDAYHYFKELKEQASVLFKKSTFLGASGDESALSSRVEIDNLDQFFAISDSDSGVLSGYESENVPAEAELLEPIGVRWSFLTTQKLADQHQLDISEMYKRLRSKGYVTIQNDKHVLTNRGVEAGGTTREGPHGPFIVWPSSIFEREKLD